MANLIGPKYTSAGIHNHVWTFFIAVGSLFLSIFGLIFGVLTLIDLEQHEANETTLNPFIFEGLFFENSTVDYIFVGEVLIRSFALLIASAVLIFANRTLKHQLYWPFIIYCFIFMCVLFIRLVLIIGTYIFITIRDYSKPHRIQHTYYSSFSATILVAFCLLCLQVFFNIFVKSGRLFLIDKEKDEKLHNLNVED